MQIGNPGNSKDTLTLKIQASLQFAQTDWHESVLFLLFFESASDS